MVSLVLFLANKHWLILFKFSTNAFNIAYPLSLATRASRRKSREMLVLNNGMVN